MSADETHRSRPRPTNPQTALLDAIEAHHIEGSCGAPVGTVVETVLDDPTIGLADAMLAFRDLRVTGEVYQPSDTTVALVDDGIDAEVPR